MQLIKSPRRIQKQHIAVLFALLALLSWAFDAANITQATLPRDLSQVPLALAYDNRVTGPLEMFLRVDGVSGDATDQKHKSEIEIDSYVLQMSRAMAATKPSLQTFIVTMPTGKAFPRLFLNAAAGLRIPKIVLTVRKTGTSLDFITWTLTDTAIVSLKTVGNTHGDGVSDQIEIAFGKIETEFVPADGSAVQKAGWDQRTGKSVGY